MSESVPTAPDTVLIFGLGGAGKSTLARRLSEHLGLRLLHPSGIIRDLLQGRVPDLEHTVCNDGYWESPEGVRLLKARLWDDEPVDVRVHRILLEAVEAGNVIIDTWSLPWLTDKGFRIKLTASLACRGARAAARSGISEPDARALIQQKDEDTRALFMRLHGFDIFQDEARFDLVVDTETLDSDGVFEAVLEGFERARTEGRLFT